jgi:hypothetical protein
MERLEHTARILLTARLLGNVERLTGSEVEKLLGASGAGGPSPQLPCVPGASDAAGVVTTGEGAMLADIIRQVIESRGFESGG